MITHDRFARRRGPRERQPPAFVWSYPGQDHGPDEDPGCRWTHGRSVEDHAILAAPAAVEVWSGWVGIAQKTGFGMVSPLPGIWPALHVDTAITLPIGVEAYAAYALRAWLSGNPATSARTHRFAKRSTITSFLLGMAGQITYHLLNQTGTTRAPWIVTTIVSCLPVLVLAMATTLAHILRADTADHAYAPTPDTPPPERRRPATASARTTARDTHRPGITDHTRKHTDQGRHTAPRPAIATTQHPGTTEHGPTTSSRHGHAVSDTGQHSATRTTHQRNSTMHVSTSNASSPRADP